MTCQVHFHVGRDQHASHHQGLGAQQALPWDTGLLCCLSAEGESGSVTQSSFISEQALGYEQKVSLITEVQKKGVRRILSGLKNHSWRRLENQTRTWGENHRRLDHPHNPITEPSRRTSHCHDYWLLPGPAIR